MRRGAWLVGLSLLQLALVVVTAFPPFSPHLGEPVWHHNASLAFALVTVGLWWGVARARGRSLWLDRAHLGIWVLVWTVLATTSGFLLLYLKQELKGWLLKDWAKFWHILWSWFALVYFIVHTAVNWSGLRKALGRIHARLGPALRFDLGLLAIVAAIPLTWSAWGARVWTEASYIPWSLWTTLAVVGLLYAAWLYGRVRRASDAPAPGWAGRVGAQTQTDAWLLVSAVLANLSGFPLLYFNTKETSLKYVAKYWHTWPSIVFAVLVFAHAIQFWAGMRAHWRRGERKKSEPA